MAVKISAEAVKNLREQTGAGMMECKNALVQAEGDVAKAEDIIAKMGHRKAAKSASRTAKEGLIAIKTASDNHKGVLVEINCETDFVARDESFKAFVEAVGRVALETGQDSVEALLQNPIDGYDSIEDARKALIAKIGENIQIRRMRHLRADQNESIGAYLHGNRIGVLVKMKGGDVSLSRDVAMHIAAMSPQFIAPKDVSADVIAKEKEILVARAKESGKPDNIIEKIVQGQLNKYLNDICLLGQPFVKDQDISVENYLKTNKATLLDFVRFAVGEGIQVTKMSFQEEVMAQARGK